MKWLIASDIHGSAYWCGKLIDAINRESPGRVLLLGDILYHGPRNDLPRDYSPKAAAEMLNRFSADIMCVHGNCEAEVDQLMLDFPILAEYALICTEKFPRRLIFATHGHHFNCENLPPLHPGDILLHGHTHVPVIEEYENYVYLNPGSVSIPKNDTPNSYMTFENGLFLWKDMAGESFMEYPM